MRSEFTALRIRPANRDIPRADDGTPPEQWLIAEWAIGKAEPTDHWLANLPADTPIAWSASRRSAGASNTTTGN